MLELFFWILKECCHHSSGYGAYTPTISPDITLVLSIFLQMSPLTNYPFMKFVFSLLLRVLTNVLTIPLDIEIVLRLFLRTWKKDSNFSSGYAPHYSSGYGASTHTIPLDMELVLRLFIRIWS